ncbi:MAG TPA: hypothetical protein VOA41_08260 [Candidatus Dormibacteraeota bacterium]|nr:hypothetical protein [Candidatus Dormibacteraeota bacterium]
MNCAEAAECVSALFDGEPISREVVAHLSDCKECRARLNDYAEMGAELREAASGAGAQTIPEGRWRLAEPAAATNWLRKWRGTMRIPRFAFALMLIAIFALSGGLALVKARPGGNGPVLLLSFKIPQGDKAWDCALRTDRGPDSCAFFGANLPGELAVSARFIRREGERVQLGIKTNFTPAAAMQRQYTHTFELKMFDGISEQEYWLEREEKLNVPVAQFGTVEVSGEYLDHMPVMASNPRETLDPGKAEFRILSPVLIRDHQMLVNMARAMAIPDEKDNGVMLHIPREGLFIFSPVPFEEGAEVAVRHGSNQIEFTAEGKSYLLVTGAPITRAEHVWVRHLPDWHPSNNQGWFLGGVNVQRLREFLEKVP